jgi:hypothetical protein
MNNMTQHKYGSMAGVKNPCKIVRPGLIKVKSSASMIFFRRRRGEFATGTVRSIGKNNAKFVEFVCRRTLVLYCFFSLSATYLSQHFFPINRYIFRVRNGVLYPYRRAKISCKGKV